MATKQVKMKIKEINQSLRSAEKELKEIYEEALHSMLDEERLELVCSVIKDKTAQLGCLTNILKTPISYVERLAEITGRNVRKFQERIKTSGNETLRKGAENALRIEKGKLDLILWGLRFQLMPNRKSKRVRWEKMVGWKYPAEIGQRQPRICKHPNQGKGEICDTFDKGICVAADDLATGECLFAETKRGDV